MWGVPGEHWVHTPGQPWKLLFLLFLLFLFFCYFLTLPLSKGSSPNLPHPPRRTNKTNITVPKVSLQLHVQTLVSAIPEEAVNGTSDQLYAMTPVGLGAEMHKRRRNAKVHNRG